MDPHPPQVPSVTSELESLREDLEGLNASVADKFLGLATKLQSITAMAREQASLSREATLLAGEGRSGQAFTALQQILSDAGKAEVLAAASSMNFREILAGLERSRQPLACLFQLRSVLRSLSIFSRIESSRFLNSDVDFSSLAKDIDELAEQVEMSLNSISEEADRLIALVRRGIEQLENIRTAEGDQAATLISKTQAVLDPLRQRADASEQIARKIDEQYAAMRQETDRIVMSLQMEDLARQRVEHIQEALHRVGDQAAAGDANWLATFVLQRSQLTSTSKLLADAVGSVIAGLQALGIRSEVLAAETASLSVQMETDKRSFEAATGDGLGAIASVFAQYSTSAHAVLSTGKTVVSAVTGMTKAAERLEDIQLSMRLIAINAAIKTAQLGTEGAAMSAIAAALQNSAADSRTNTQLVIECLSAIPEALADISVHGSASADSILMRSDVKEVAATVAQLAECVSNSRSELTGKLNVLLNMAGSLQDEVVSAQGVAQASASDDAFSNITNSFNALLQQFGGAESVSRESADTTKLKELYSMQSEREVHEQTITRFCEGKGTPMESNSASEGKDNDLGDGVELF
jgi:hypothetical protein